MAYELQFLVMVNTALERDEIYTRLMKKLQGAHKVRSQSFDWSDNWIRVWTNDDYDPNAISDPDDGFLHYRYRIEVSPNKKNATVEHQVHVAKELARVLESVGCAAVICADFEGLL